MTPLLNTLAEITFKYEGEVYTVPEEAVGILVGVAVFFGLIGFALLVLMLIDAWKIYKKMGRRGWEGIIPIYDVYVLCRETGVNPWWMLTIFIPPVFAIFLLILMVRLCEGFGKTTLFTVLTTMFSPIFLTIIAFDNSKWDAGRINMNSADFINDKNYEQPKKRAKKHEEEDPWVEGKEVKKAKTTKKAKK